MRLRVLLFVGLFFYSTYIFAQQTVQITNMSVALSGILRWTVNGYSDSVGSFIIEKKVPNVGWRRIDYDIPNSDDKHYGVHRLEKDLYHFSIIVDMDSGYNEFRIKLLQDTGSYNYKLRAIDSIKYFCPQRTN